MAVVHSHMAQNVRYVETCFSEPLGIVLTVNVSEQGAALIILWVWRVFWSGLICEDAQYKDV